tara:strand:- start:171 stop:308 length:138 start_codon:yes stop_codon:yes gene_type:complete
MKELQKKKQGLNYESQTLNTVIGLVFIAVIIVFAFAAFSLMLQNK